MPSPHLDGEGRPVVPPLTAFVLEKFESDDRVFSAFCSSRHNLQVYRATVQSERGALMRDRHLDRELRCSATSGGDREGDWQGGDDSFHAFSARAKIAQRCSNGRARPEFSRQLSSGGRTVSRAAAS